MAVGFFTDKQYKPSDEEIIGKIGGAKLFWDELIEHISNAGRCKSEFIFYGKNYGWSLRFKKSGGAIASLYPGEEMFTAQIILAPKHLDKLSGLKLHANAKKTLAEATLFPEGKWLFIKIISRNDLMDAKKLIDLKCGSEE